MNKLNHAKCKSIQAITASFIILFFLSAILSCNNKIKSLSLDHKIGQMIMVGFRGYELADDTKLAKQLKSGIVGGIVLFDYDIESKKSERNIKSPEQVKKLISELNSYSKYPLLISIDQEGGAVTRLKEKYGFEKLPKAQYLGNLNIVDSTEKYALINSKSLNELGINVNFAPVVDLNINPENPAIGKYGRSFSENPKTVIEHSKKIINTQIQHKIKSVIKHYPGHGSSDKDSHNGIVDVTNSWTEEELRPYFELTFDPENIGVMTAHIYNKTIDPIYPATLSKKTIQKLRNEIKFNGVIFSDDMQMKAITSEYSLEEIIKLGINSGLDVFVFGNNLDYDEELPNKFIAIVKKLIETGELNESRINESLARIKSFKKNLK